MCISLNTLFIFAPAYPCKQFLFIQKVFKGSFSNSQPFGYLKAYFSCKCVRQGFVKGLFVGWVFIQRAGICQNGINLYRWIIEIQTCWVYRFQMMTRWIPAPKYFRLHPKGNVYPVIRWKPKGTCISFPFQKSGFRRLKFAIQ